MTTVATVAPPLRATAEPLKGIDAALALAQQGRLVTPIRDGKPFIVGWWDAATTKEPLLRKWWEIWPDSVPGTVTRDEHGAAHCAVHGDEQTWHCASLDQSAKATYYCPVHGKPALRPVPAGATQPAEHKVDAPQGVDAALAVAEKGYRVFPCSLVEGEDGKLKKTPLINDNLKRATREAKEIRGFWSDFPEAFVAVVPDATMLVVDVDVKDGQGGDRTWEELTKGLVPQRPAQQTWSGGWHHWYAIDGTRRFSNTAKVNGLAGIDLRTSKGWAVVYTADLPRREDLPDLPEQIAEQIAIPDPQPVERRSTEPDPRRPVEPLGPAGQGKAFADELDRVRGVPEGQRNDTLNKAAFNLGQLVGPTGLDEDEVREELLGAGLDAGLDEDEVRATVHSGVRAGKADPRPTSSGGTTPTPVAVADCGSVAERYPRLDLAALLNPDRPEREWVVSGLISAGASVSLVAPAGTMKSLLMLALSLSVARGDREFAGLTIPRRRRVMYVDMENTEDDLADRMRSLGVRPDDLDLLTYLHLPSLPPLDTALGGAELLAVVEHYGLGAGDLIVLDSFQRVVTGAENDADTYRAFYAATAAPLKKLGLTVVRTDNTGKDTERGARGSSSKRDDVDIELRMTRSDNLLTLEPGKVRLGGIEPVIVTPVVDDNDRLTFTTGSDPFRAAVAAARDKLDALGLPPDTPSRRAEKALKEAGHGAPRAAVRQAVRDRKQLAAAGDADPWTGKPR